MSYLGEPVRLKGVLIADNADPRKQSPIQGVEISAADGMALGAYTSDSAGFFSIRLRRRIRPGQKVTLQFRHPDYQPLDHDDVADDKIYIARMTPNYRETQPAPRGPEVVISNVSVRYSIQTTTTTNIGGAVKMFEVPNASNVPCKTHLPCSPDGKWKATAGSASLDAGHGNEFRNARVSCIAGPCPFTKIESDNFSYGGRTISVSVRNWADTVTFLLEAEVFRPEITNRIQQTHPAILGRTMNFTLPATAQGPSVEAEVDGMPIVFPLGPIPRLSWALCEASDGKDQKKAFRCELKPGYRFKQSEDGSKG